MTDQALEAPENWKVLPLGEVTALVKEKVDPTHLPEAPYVGLEHIEAHTMRLLGHGRGADVKSAKTRFSTGDVLYGKLRPYLNKVAVPDFSGICSTDILVFSESPDLDPRYLANFLNQLWVAERAHHLSNGVELPRVDWKSLSQLAITFPASRSQQRAIVQQIESARSLQASASEHLATARRAIERFRQSILAAACSGRLTADWREGNADTEPALALVERSRAVLAKRARARRLTDDTAVPDWLEIPETWEWAPLGSLAEIKGGIQKQPKRAPKENAYPYLRVANVLRGRLDLSEIHRFELFDDELNTYRLLPGDLLIVEGNGSLTEIGRSAIWNGAIDDCVHQNHIIRVRCVEADPRFIDLVWNSPVGAREVAELAVTSSGLYSLSAGKIAAFAIPVPPLEEQSEIVRRASALLQLANAQLVRVDAAARGVEKSAQAVLAKAFRGELIGDLT
ncbi:MAG: restriction endonuclease subunit S [Acidobacteriota bacterium]